MRELIAVIAINAFITSLAFKHEEAIYDVPVALDIRAVIRILIIGCCENEIAIAIAVREIGVIAVFALLLEIERPKRARTMQCIKLIKERL